MLRAKSLIVTFAFLALALAGCSDSLSPSPGAAGVSEGNAEPPPVVRPTLIARSGDYFKWVMPKDWKASESSNGVDLTSPDGSMAASSAVLMGSNGTSDPWSFLTWALSATGSRDIERVSAEDLPPQPSGYP